MVTVAFVLPHFHSGGAEGVVLKVLQHLDRNRFRPTLILQSKEGSLLDQLPPDVSVIALRGSGLPRSILPLARVLRQERFDIVHTFTNAISVLCQISRFISRRSTATILSEHTPLILFMTGAKFYGVRRILMQLTYASAARFAAPIKDICEEHKALLGSACPPCVVLPNPVIDVAGAHRYPAAQVTHCVSLCRLAPEKRVDLMIRIFAKAFADRADVNLSIWGDGPEEAGLRSLIADLGLVHRVFLCGYTHDVPAALADADLFLCTSEREGLGNAIIEAMAHGVPVFSVDCPFGPRHLLQDGQAGRLVSSDDPHILSGELRSFADNHAERCAAAIAARASATRFETEAAVAAYEALYSEVALASTSGVLPDNCKPL